MHLLGVNQGMTTAFHPSADGQVEKMNQIMEIGLRYFLDDDLTKYSKWVDYLPILEHEYNSLIHSSTSFSPNELWFSTPPCGISNLATPPYGSFKSVEQLTDNLKNARDDIQDTLALAQWKQKRYADVGWKSKLFEPGDLVILKYNHFGPGYKPLNEYKHKLAPCKGTI